MRTARTIRRPVSSCERMAVAADTAARSAPTLSGCAAAGSPARISISTMRAAPGLRPSRHRDVQVMERIPSEAEEAIDLHDDSAIFELSTTRGKRRTPFGIDHEHFAAGLIFPAEAQIRRQRRVA